MATPSCWTLVPGDQQPVDVTCASHAGESCGRVAELADARDLKAHSPKWWSCGGASVFQGDRLVITRERGPRRPLKPPLTGVATPPVDPAKRIVGHHQHVQAGSERQSPGLPLWFAAVSHELCIGQDKSSVVRKFGGTVAEDRHSIRLSCRNTSPFRLSSDKLSCLTLTRYIPLVQQ